MELDGDCDEGNPGGSGMPACFDLCGGGFLSPAAHAGTGFVVRADIVRRGSRLAQVGDAVKSEVNRAGVMSSLALGGAGARAPHG